MNASQQNKAQTAIEAIAPEPTLGDLQAWLLGAQRDALYSMNTSTGDVFGKHCDRFMQLTTAYQVVGRFMDLNRS